MRDRVQVYDKYFHFTGNHHHANTVGRAFYLHFRGYNEDPPQFMIEADEEDGPEAVADPS
jgi:hypothetical protein